MTKMARLLLLAAGFVLLSCGPSRTLDVYGTIPDFQLTDHRGQPFSGKNLEGSLWVADFMFTHCAGPCPRMGSQMRRLQQSFPREPRVKFVSFTVDPARDTPEVLAAYARKFQAIDGRWYFLTGAQETLHQLSREGFMLGDVDGDLTHSTRFVLLDSKRRIRAFYRTEEQGVLKQIVADLELLLRENS